MEEERTVVMKAEPIPEPKSEPKFFKRETDYKDRIDPVVVMLSFALGYISAGFVSIEFLGSVTVLAVVAFEVASFVKEFRGEMFSRLYMWVAPFFLMTWATYLLRH